MTKLELIATTCPVCRATASSPYAEENGFTLVRCGDCGLLYVTPRRDPAAPAAAHEYGVHPGDTTFEVTGRYRPGRIAAYRSVCIDACDDLLAATIALGSTSGAVWPVSPGAEAGF
jgi:Zn ribbon nucleic-acid-binding protein